MKKKISQRGYADIEVEVYDIKEGSVKFWAGFNNSQKKSSAVLKSNSRGAYFTISQLGNVYLTKEEVNALS